MYFKDLFRLGLCVSGVGWWAAQLSSMSPLIMKPGGGKVRSIQEDLELIATAGRVKTEPAAEDLELIATAGRVKTEPAAAPSRPAQDDSDSDAE